MQTSYVDNSEAQSASGSNIYMANGIPYTYHHGAAFFSTSQQYSPPVAVLSPPPAQPQISTQDNTSYYQGKLNIDVVIGEFFFHYVNPISDDLKRCS